jgi:hypothetical protein
MRAGLFLPYFRINSLLSTFILLITISCPELPANHNWDA